MEMHAELTAKSAGALAAEAAPEAAVGGVAAEEEGEEEGEEEEEEGEEEEDEAEREAAKALAASAPKEILVPSLHPHLAHLPRIRVACARFHPASRPRKAEMKCCGAGNVAESVVATIYISVLQWFATTVTH